MGRRYQLRGIVTATQFAGALQIAVVIAQAAVVVRALGFFKNFLVWTAVVVHPAAELAREHAEYGSGSGIFQLGLELALRDKAFQVCAAVRRASLSHRRSAWGSGSFNALGLARSDLSARASSFMPPCSILARRI